MDVLLLMLLAGVYLLLTGLDLFHRRNGERRSVTRIHVPDDDSLTEA